MSKQRGCLVLREGRENLSSDWIFFFLWNEKPATVFENPLIQTLFSGNFPLFLFPLLFLWKYSIPNRCTRQKLQRYSSIHSCVLFRANGATPLRDRSRRRNIRFGGVVLLGLSSQEDILNNTPLLPALHCYNRPMLRFNLPNNTVTTSGQQLAAACSVLTERPVCGQRRDWALWNVRMREFWWVLTEIFFIFNTFLN